MELLLGCGSHRAKKLHEPGNTEWKQLVTLDYNEDHDPDVVHDLEIFPYPFKHDAFDEIHAYEVLEHTGNQGDYRFFFKQFEELYRILKPGGKLYASVPRWDSVWAWGDPSHKRILNEGSLAFLSQDAYKQVGTTAMSDFRNIYQGNFELLYKNLTDHQFWFILRAIK